MFKLNFFKKNKFLYWVYKIQKIYKNKTPNFHYAEFAEDVMVNRIFKNYSDGFYLDIGAYHPIKGSLTYKLYKKGWKGMNLDISKTSIDLFDIARPKDKNINCAIGNFSGDTFYYENSPINQQNSLIKSNVTQKKVEIKSFLLEEILILNKIDKVDFINIDTEGTELNIINSINFEKINPILFTIEENSFDTVNESRNAKIELMKKNNYELINVIGVTMFFIKADMVSKVSDLIRI